MNCPHCGRYFPDPNDILRHQEAANQIVMDAQAAQMDHMRQRELQTNLAFSQRYPQGSGPQGTPITGAL